MKNKVYLALIHHPVYNKRRDVVATSITGFDLHDIARSAVTFGIKKYFVVNPLPAQRKFAKRIFDFWMDKTSLEFNWTRVEAFKRVDICSDLKEVEKKIKKQTKSLPIKVATSAKTKNGISFKDLREKIKKSTKPVLILFGTGWGMTEDVIGDCDYVLEAIDGPTKYNHLSVRSAVAIILDRLLGKN